MFDHLVDVEIKNKVAVLSLNRVDKLNALSWDLVDSLDDALSDLKPQISKNKIGVVVIKSNSEKAFCVGADLKERLKMDESKILETLDKFRKLMDSIQNIEVPTIAVVEGAAFGGGLELALACDLRIFSTTAKVGLTETKLAIIPGAGGTQRLSRLVGLARAKELIFRARRLSSDEALSLGLCESVSDKAFAEAMNWASDIVKAGPLAIKAAKLALDEGHFKELSDALDFERHCYQKYVLYTKDRVEALNAFVEKREASFIAE